MIGKKVINACVDCHQHVEHYLPRLEFKRVEPAELKECDYCKTVFIQSIKFIVDSEH